MRIGSSSWGIYLTFVARLVLGAPSVARTQQPFVVDDADVTPARVWHLEISNQIDGLRPSARPARWQNALRIWLATTTASNRRASSKMASSPRSQWALVLCFERAITPRARIRDLGRRFPFTNDAVAVAAVAIAAAIDAALWPEFGRRYPLILFYPAIMVAAWAGGLRSGGLATTLSTLIAAIVWFQSQNSTTVSRQGDVLALTLFAGVGFTISTLCESLKRHAEREQAAREQAGRAVREARDLALEVRISQDRLLDVERRARHQAEQATA